MKRFIIGCIVSIMLLFQACDSALDVSPKNAVTFTNYFETEQDLESLMVGMHAWLADALKVFYAQEYVGVITEKEPYYVPGSIRSHRWESICEWQDFYAVIYQCNLLFDNVKKPVCSQDRMDFYFGQAKFIKAMAYFELGRRWGDAVITGSTEDAPQLAKRPAEEVLDTALANAMAAYKLLPKHEELKDRVGRTITSKQYGSKGTCAALIANIYAWRAVMDKGITADKSMEYWGKVEEWASKIIDTDECGYYELEATIKDLVAGTLNKRGGKESIFELELNVDDKTIENLAYNSAYLFVGFPLVPRALPGDMDWNQWQISNGRIKAMYPGNDERRQEYFYKLDDYSHPDSVAKYGNYAYVYKYRSCYYTTDGVGNASFINFDVNKVYWRLADLILLRAEARYHLGNEAGAIDDLDRIRKRANAVLFEDAPEADLKMAIFREREKELLFEDHRFWDVMRNGYVKTELPEFYREGLSDIDINNGALYLPVPQGAFYLNPLMLQNVYWLNKL